MYQSNSAGEGTASPIGSLGATELDVVPGSMRWLGLSFIMVVMVGCRRPVRAGDAELLGRMNAHQKYPCIKVSRYLFQLTQLHGWPNKAGLTGSQEVR